MLLIERGLSLEDVATGTGLSLSLIKKIATKKKRPTPRTIARTENFCGARLWSTPRQYQTRAERRHPRTQTRRYTFPAGCAIEFSDVDAAIAFAGELSGYVDLDGKVTTFTRSTPVLFRFSHEGSGTTGNSAKQTALKDAALSNP